MEYKLGEKKDDSEYKIYIISSMEVLGKLTNEQNKTSTKNSMIFITPLRVTSRGRHYVAMSIRSIWSNEKKNKIIKM